MKVLVCGGRSYKNPERINEVLREYEIDLLIEGGADGADFSAGEYADRNNIAHLTVWADWDKYGKKAGYMRNAKMLTFGPDLVIAFPGGRGTANMIKLAKEVGVEVIEIE
jgi:hypothetical protein